MADLVGSARTVFAVWQPKFCLRILTPTGTKFSSLLSLKRFLMQVWASGPFFAGGACPSHSWSPFWGTLVYLLMACVWAETHWPFLCRRCKSCARWNSCSNISYAGILNRVHLALRLILYCSIHCTWLRSTLFRGWFSLSHITYAHLFGK